MKTIIAMLLLLPVAIMANAECHFRVSNSIVCTSPRAAAFASQKFGEDIALTNISYNRQLMREAGCGRPYGSSYAKIKISQINSGRIATPNGWVDIATISANNHDLWYVAKRYLSGTCEKYVPIVGSAHENKSTWVEPPDPSNPLGPPITHYETPTTVMP